MAAPKKTGVDWELIENDWRAGIKSALQIAGEHGISHTAINKRFKKLGITRDLKAKIKAKADALVSAALVSGIVSTETTAKTATIIEANAVEQANGRLLKKKNVARNIAIHEKLTVRLEAMTSNEDGFAKLGEIMAAPDEAGRDKLNEIYRSVISTPGLIDTHKKSAETLKILHGAIDDALGLNEASKDKATDTIAALRALHGIE